MKPTKPTRAQRAVTTITTIGTPANYDRWVVRLQRRVAIRRIIIKVLTFPWRGAIGSVRHYAALVLGMIAVFVGVEIGSDTSRVIESDMVMVFANVIMLPWIVRSIIFLVQKITRAARRLLDAEVEALVREEQEAQGLLEDEIEEIVREYRDTVR